jgi:hypothetical protein
MSAAFPSSLEAPAPSKSRLLCANAGDNNVGPKGCWHLAQRQWDNLQQLRLSTTNCHSDRNNIGSQGCRQLSHMQVSHLNNLDLGNSAMRQHLTKSKRVVANTFPRPAGRSSTVSVFVIHGRCRKGQNRCRGVSSTLQRTLTRPCLNRAQYR